MVADIAILRTRPIPATLQKPGHPAPCTATPVAPKKKEKSKQPIRDAIIAALSEIMYYETPDGKKIRPGRVASYQGPVVSVGMPYSAVIAKVKKKFPYSKVSDKAVHSTATNIRNGEAGFETGNLPHKRPRSMNGVPHG